MRRPAILLAHMPGIQFLSDRHLDDLDTVGRLLNRDAIGDWSADGVDDLLAEAEVIVGHWGMPYVDESVLDRAPKLGLVTYAAGTVKWSVGEAVFDRGVRVTSGANANAEPVAEFTLATILFVNKDVFWQRDVGRDPSIASHRTAAPTVGNWNKTIGIVGASIIGRRVIELLAPFPRLRVVLYDPYVSAEEATALGVEKLELDELCAAAHVVSIHAPDIPETRGMIRAPQLAAMRDGATLVNTARGALVDTDALVAECEAGRLSAVLDVTEPEPLPDDHPLRRLPNVYLTPHLAGSQGTELGRMSEYAVEEVRRFAAGEAPMNGITKERLARLA